MKIFRIKKHIFEKEISRIDNEYQDYTKWNKNIQSWSIPSTDLKCVTIYQSSTLGLTWKHLVSYVSDSCDRKEFYRRQEKYYKEAEKEIETLNRTENCKHKNTHLETVSHPGGEVGNGLICDDCDKLIKYE